MKSFAYVHAAAGTGSAPRNLEWICHSEDQPANSRREVKNFCFPLEYGMTSTSNDAPANMNMNNMIVKRSCWSIVSQLYVSINWIFLLRILIPGALYTFQALLVFSLFKCNLVVTQMSVT